PGRDSRRAAVDLPPRPCGRESSSEDPRPFSLPPSGGTGPTRGSASSRSQTAMTTVRHDHHAQRRPFQEGGAVQPIGSRPVPTLTALLGGTPAVRGVPCQEHPADLWFAELPQDVETAKSLC